MRDSRVTVGREAKSLKHSKRGKRRSVVLRKDYAGYAVNSSMTVTKRWSAIFAKKWSAILKHCLLKGNSTKLLLLFFRKEVRKNEKV